MSEAEEAVISILQKLATANNSLLEVLKSSNSLEETKKFLIKGKQNISKANEIIFSAFPESKLKEY